MALSVVVVAPSAQASVAGSTISAQPAKAYTMAQVKTHKTASNCWTVVNKKVYNVTGWVNKHPGGSSRIVAMCGKDGTALFNSQHASSASAKRSLNAYKIGTLK
jgi:cytochrome b involved in lipid metabolism